MKQFLYENSIPFKENVLLSKKTWIKTGGICSYWITPNTLVQLEEVCNYLYTKGIKFDIVGQTSNLFYHSTCKPQVVISTTNINQSVIKGDVITCDCGCNVMHLAKKAMEAGYAGFYGLIGLPGTVASAVVNNAGCYGCSISSMLISADVLMSDGSVRTMVKKDFGFIKRSSVFKRKEVNGVILSVNLKLKTADDVDGEYRKAERVSIDRKRNQEGYAMNLGSIYATKTRRKNIKNAISAICVKVAGWIGYSDKAIVQKHTLLRLYGYRDLDQYISNKTINTFIWRDICAEHKFCRYKQFMSKVYRDLKMEIEERV